MINITAGLAPNDTDWSALLARQPVDQFYGVITTGIVCRPGCPARTPLRKNVRVFVDLGDAKLAGYRACKRCKPTAATPENSRSI